MLRRSMQRITAQSQTMGTASGLPEGWSFASVGSPARVGAAVSTNGSIGVTGAGSGIGGRADQFSYVYRLMTGDFDAVVRVGSVDEALERANAGLSIRSSLTTDAAHVSLLAASTSGVSVESRATAGSPSSRIGAGAAVLPVWLKLERRDASVTAFTSTDGRRWTSIASASVVWPSAVYVGLTVTSEETRRLASAVFSDASVDAVVGSVGTTLNQALAMDAGSIQTLVAASNLPSGWAAADVGNPAISGNVSYSNGSFSMEAAGRDIWDAADQFTYAYRQVTGDVEIVTRVTALERVDVWTKVGPMVRASLDPASAHATLFTSATNGIAFQRRPSTGAESVHTAAGTGSTPVWLRLVRRGSTITASRSTDGSRWTTVGTQTLSLPSTFYVGLALTSTRASEAASATIQNVTVTGAAADGSAPTVSITSPSAGAPFTAPATVDITATAADSDGTIAKVEFFNGSTSIKSDTSSPYSARLSDLAAGTYNLTAVATDDDGNTTTSAVRQVVVSAVGNTAPTVSLTITGGTTFTAPATVTVNATAADSDGIARVEFRSTSSSMPTVTDTAGAYSASWSNVPAGTYTLTAVAIDSKGASTTSNSIQITVNAASTPVPTKRVTFTASPDHASVQRYVLEIFSQGANPATATVRASRDLGKPSVSNNEISVVVSDTVASLPAGNYIATVTAVSSGGSTRSAASPAFTK